MSASATLSLTKKAVNLDSNFKATETARDPVPAAAAAADSSARRIEIEDHDSDNDSVLNCEDMDDSLAVNRENEESADSAPKIAAAADTIARPPRNNDTDDDILVTGGTAAAAVETETSDTHKIHEQALAKSCSVLKVIDTLLQDNPLFCSQDRRQEWSQEIQEILAKSAPKTIIGVLGNTGVGKSSLLNALLDEAAVLPTSGSRGCTAAVVELRFNSDLTMKEQPKQATATATATVERVAVYKGEVEFMTLAEWGHELKILIDECSTHEEKTIYARPPDDQRQPDAAAAWGKYNAVEQSILQNKETQSHPEAH
jgi:ABC-type glutathione transport system ATPase component